ncbi:MAG TPA: PilW family protein, partial [Accumulibacter sp.]|nr:PilW family protein [Accumulibacter sp.]
TTAARTFTFPLVPVRIVQGDSGAPDTLQVLYGNSSFFSASQAYVGSTAFTKKMKWRNDGFRVYRNAAGVVERGDLVIVADVTPTCSLIEVSNDPDIDGWFQHSAGLRFNSALGTVAALAEGSLFNLGPQPQLNLWTVNNGSLVVTDGLYRNTTATVADGIIDLQAEYGLDTNGDFVVDTWQTADPSNWRQVLAIRVALLARSQHYEAPRQLSDGSTAYATSTAPSLPWTDGTGQALHFAMHDVDGAADTNPQTDANWRNYRYRVYGGVISLRNMIWGVAP